MKKETFWDVWEMDNPLSPERRGGRLYLSTKPYDPEKVYTFHTYPIADNRSPSGWREQFPLGWYMQYAETCGPNGESVYAFAGGSARWFHSCRDAREWIEKQTLKRTYWDVRYEDDPMGRACGWLFVEAEPYDRAKARDYTYSDCPVSDDRSSTGWREQSALGWYVSYTETHGPNGETVYAAIPRDSVRSSYFHTTQWFHSTQQAREWIETNTRR